MRRQLLTWPGNAGRGFVRACAVVAVSMLVPAVWAAAVVVAVRWAANPWSWTPLVVMAGVATLGFSRPVCRAFRSLVAGWTGTVVPAGYREAPPVVRLSTGYWWNGFTYAKSSARARQEQEWRVRWRDPAIRRDLRFVAIAPVTTGLVCAVPPAGVVAAVLGFIRATPPAVALGVLGLLVAVASAPHAWRSAEPVAVRFLRPSRATELAHRVEELTAQRADTTVAQAAEIRRIERDLHDGAQGRLVALGLSLATAEKLMETDPDRARALLREARAGAATSLTELRELVRGISPPVLTERGLVDAVRALALDSPLEVEVTAGVRGRLDPPIESAVYFGVAELMTNAAKHARASHVRVSLVEDGPDLVVRVEDDGVGGVAEGAGGGLAGLRRRLAAFDATMEVSSPAGGPTRVTMVVPCESS
jgi:signal transduction histidine kinase